MQTSQIPATGFMRVPQIIGSPGKPASDTEPATPAIPAIIPVSKSTWWAGVRSGRYPKPVKLGDRITAWRAEDIRALVESMSNGEAA